MAPASAALAAGLLLLATGFARPAAAAADDGFVLKLLTNDSAVCLDGSPGGYYLRPGSADSWMIELEGGGWCYTPEQCLERSTTAIGSSKSWPATGCPSMDGGSKGMLSNNCSTSQYCNWTAVHANYCDGGSFAGHVAAPVVVGGKQLYLRGRDILDATIDTLLSSGLAHAKEVILKGCSAGGLAVLLHLDYFAARVKAVNPSIRVSGMPDASFFLDHTTVVGTSVYTPEIQSAVALHQPLQPGSVNDACLAAHQPTGDAWRCFMAQYVLPHIATPYYMTQDLVDTWQLANIALLPCQPWVAGSCNATELAWMDAYRLDMLAALAPLLASPTNGGFLTSCVQHCHEDSDLCWTQSRVANQTLAQSFAAWYSGNSSLQRIVVDGPYGTDKACFCTPYQVCAGGCGSRGGGGAAPPAAASAAVPLDLADLGVAYEGVGALSGGGGDTRLLIDYPPAVIDAVFDALFTPNAGAALHIIKVEIGGDSQSTEGVEQSHRRSRDDLNCSRGYEWGVLAAARARNPAIKTYGLSWGAPGWVGNGTFYSADGIDYHVSWLDCATDAWNISLDYLGIWNEVNYDADWTIALRHALDDAGYQHTRLVAADVSSWDVAADMAANPALAAAVDVIGAHYPGAAPSAATHEWARAAGKPLWASEMWNLQATNDYAGALALASDLSRYARYGLSASIAWCLIYSWYPNLNYGHASNVSNGGSGHALLSAAEPWSGAWSVEAPVAVLAHWTQFAQPGWRFLNASGSGVGTLPGGGTYATLVSPPDAPPGDLAFSVVLETSACLGATTATFRVQPPAGAALPRALHVWCTVEGALFRQQPDAPVDAASGEVSLALPPRAVCSATTTTGQGWVQPPAQPVPSTRPFPFPYSESFDGYAAGAYARYWSDMGGVWNVAQLPPAMAAGGGSGSGSGSGGGSTTVPAAAPRGAYQQVLPSSPINWYWDRTPYPFTCAGNGNPSGGGAITSWTDYAVAATGGFDPALPATLPQVLAGQQQPCPQPGGGGGGGSGTAFLLSGGDLVATPAYLESRDYPGMCLGVTGQLRATSAPLAGGMTVGLVNCTAPIAGEDKPLALLHDPANGRLWWRAPARYLCLQVLNSSSAQGAAAAGEAAQQPLGMLQCNGNSPSGITAWALLALDGGAVALQAVGAAAAAPGGCAGAVLAPAPPPFLFVTLRMGVTGGAALLPTGYTLVLYQSPSPGVAGSWELLYGMRSLAAGTTPASVVPGVLYTLRLAAVGANITASVDGALLGSVVDAEGGWGMVALGSSWVTAWWDGVNVTAV